MFVFYHVKLSQKRTTFAKGDKSKLKLYVLHYVLLLRGLCTLLIQNQAKHLDWLGHLHYLFTQV